MLCLEQRMTLCSMIKSVIVVHAWVFACGEGDSTKDFKKWQCESVAYIFFSLYIYSLLFILVIESKNK